MQYNAEAEAAIKKMQASDKVVLEIQTLFAKWANAKDAEAVALASRAGRDFLGNAARMVEQANGAVDASRALTADLRILILRLIEGARDT